MFPVQRQRRLPGGSAFFEFRPGILQRYRAVEYKPVGQGIRVHAKIAKALELKPVAWLGLLETRFCSAAEEPLQGLGVEVGCPVLLVDNTREVAF